jgi:hypothetical protein
MLGGLQRHREAADAVGRWGPLGRTLCLLFNLRKVISSPQVSVSPCTKCEGLLCSKISVDVNSLFTYSRTLLSSNCEYYLVLPKQMFFKKVFLLQSSIRNTFYMVT